MTQKSNSRVIIDTNKHGIRRETNLDKVAKKAKNKKQWEKDPKWKKKLNEVNSKELSTVNKDLSTDNTKLSTHI